MLMVVAALALVAAGGTQLIQSSVNMKHPDKEVAEYLRAVKLTERLDDEKLDQFVQMGIGPKTIEALKQLQIASAALRAAASPAVVKPQPELSPMPPPDSEQQKKSSSPPASMRSTTAKNCRTSSASR